MSNQAVNQAANVASWKAADTASMVQVWHLTGLLALGPAECVAAHQRLGIRGYLQMLMADPCVKYWAPRMLASFSPVQIAYVARFLGDAWAARSAGALSMLIEWGALDSPDIAPAPRATIAIRPAPAYYVTPYQAA